MASGRINLPNSVPVGIRFHPTDEEIVSYFLKNKMLGNDHLVQLIPEVDVCKHEPWELPNLSVVDSDDPEWFFFSTRDFKYSHGRRANRTTRAGYWKATGKDRKIKARRTKSLIGTKKTLVFHTGRVPNGVKTNWVIHEYHSVINYPQRTIYVVCRLKMKDDEKVDNSADNVDSDLQRRTMESAMPEVLQEENGGLLFTPPLHEANSEMLCPSAHLNWEDGIDVDELVNSLIVDGEEIEFVNSRSTIREFSYVDGEEYYHEETTDPFNNLDIQQGQPQRTWSTHLEGAMVEAQCQVFGDLPPNSSAFSECSSSSVHPHMRMMRHSGGSMFQSKHLRYEEQDNIYRCDKSSGPDISIESTDDMRQINCIFETNTPKRMFPKTKYKERLNNPRLGRGSVSRIQLQQRIGNAAVNPIKAEEASKYTANDHQDNEIRTRPPSEYFMNVIVGIILFLVFIREMVLYGDWGI